MKNKVSIFIAALLSTFIMTGCTEENVELSSTQQQVGNSVAENVTTAGTIPVAVDSQTQENQEAPAEPVISEPAAEVTEAPEQVTTVAATEAQTEATVAADEDYYYVPVPEDFEDIDWKMDIKYSYPTDAPYKLSKNVVGNYDEIIKVIKEQSNTNPDYVNEIAGRENLLASIVDNEYKKSCEDYTSQVDRLGEKSYKPATIIESEFSAKSKLFSPIIAVFMNKENKISLPVYLFEQLGWYSENRYGFVSRFGGPSEDYYYLTDVETDVVNQESVSGSKESYLKEKLFQYTGYDIDVYEDPFLDGYYANVISAENSLNMVQLKFDFDGDKLSTVRIKEFIYNNGELTNLRFSDSFRHSTEIIVNPSFTESLKEVWYNYYKNVSDYNNFIDIYACNFIDITKMAQSLISSDNSEAKIVSNTGVRHLVERDSNGGEGVASGIEFDVTISAK